MIVISSYDPRWPDEFEKIRTTLAQTLGAVALRIDHIGSTSVPGLGAKDNIDIQITVHALTNAIKTAMLNAGYPCFAPATHDHVPAGEDATPARWEKLLFTQPEGHRRANIHVRVAGNPNHAEDALIASTAAGEADVLVTNDSRLAAKIQRERVQVQVWNWGEFNG